MNKSVGMLNNYFEEVEYHQSDCVYSHPRHQTSIYLGDMSSALDTPFLLKNKIKTVITAATGMAHIQYAPQLRISHQVFPLLDIKSENIAKLFNPIHNTIEQALRIGSVLVHCAAGISRSATLVIAYLMKHKNWKFRETIEFVRLNRPKVCPNLGFERQLKEYEQILKQSCSRNSQRKKLRTSEESKYGFRRDYIPELPEIGNLGRLQIQSVVLDPSFQCKGKTSSIRTHPSSQQQARLQLKPLKAKRTRSQVEKESIKTERQVKADRLGLGIHSVFIQKIPTVDIQGLGRRRAQLRFPKNNQL